MTNDDAARAQQLWESLKCDEDPVPILAAALDEARERAGLQAYRVLWDELTNIANANTRDWDDPTDFKAWAQNRARAALAQAKGKP